MRWLYGVVAAVSVIVRQFYLPNPFECFGNWALIINLVVEPIIHIVARLLVGTVYRSGSCPALGSFLYLVAYAAITGILALMGIFSFAWWWVLIIVTVMIGIGLLLAKIGRWLNGETW